MKGILFKPDMIQAIRDKRKTVTRRLAGLKEINQEPDLWVYRWTDLALNIAYFYARDYVEHISGDACMKRVKPRYQVGETVYIKEAWCCKVDPITAKVIEGEYWYRSSNPEVVKIDDDGGLKLRKDGSLASPWLSPLFMPAWAARDFLKITGVRAERVQEITDEDALREGVYGDESYEQATPVMCFEALWDSINGEGDFALNKWVWVYSFESVDKQVEIPND